MKLWKLVDTDGMFVHTFIVQAWSEEEARVKCRDHVDIKFTHRDCTQLHNDVFMISDHHCAVA
jgi:hypothetical protein